MITSAIATFVVTAMLQADSAQSYTLPRYDLSDCREHAWTIHEASMTPDISYRGSTADVDAFGDNNDASKSRRTGLGIGINHNYYRNSLPYQINFKHALDANGNYAFRKDVSSENISSTWDSRRYSYRTSHDLRGSVRLSIHDSLSTYPTRSLYANPNLSGNFRYSPALQTVPLSKNFSVEPYDSTLARAQIETRRVINHSFDTEGTLTLLFGTGRITNVRYPATALGILGQVNTHRQLKRSISRNDIRD
ncbi:MAG: hypothetical protein GF398_16875, partial [Chitinivibrionales bacterium]|nr:hypothetical protein [Chitinivibrionales bacterium]